MCGIYSIPFIKYRIAGKTFFDYTNFIPPNGRKYGNKIIYKYSITNIAKENVSLDFRLKEIVETRSFRRNKT